MPLNNPIRESQIPQSIARDLETTAAIDAHLAATDPHPQYLSQAEGDARYEYRAGRATKLILGSQTFPANTWTSLGRFPGFALGAQGAPSAIVIGLSFTRDVSSPWQQSVCAALMGFCWWQPNRVADSGVKVPLEVHGSTGFFVSIRGDVFQQGERGIEINPEQIISVPSTGRVDISLMKIF